MGPSSSSRWRGAEDDSLLLVLDEFEVVVGVLNSVVDSGAVLVMVAVVVGVDVGVREAVAENEGSTKLSGTSAGSSFPVTNMTAATRPAMTATPTALAPSTARVELCQGSDGWSPPNSSTNSSSSNSSSPSFTDTDIRPGTCGNAGSAELRDHFGGEQLQVVQIGHIQKLQVDALHADLGERPELVDDFIGCAR